MSKDCFDFIHRLQWKHVPPTVQSMTRQCLTDLLAVAVSGTQTDLSRIIRDHAHQQFGPAHGSHGSRMLFDGRRCSATGAALAGGMTIDSIDAHDGYKPVKGHAGCGVLPAVLAMIDSELGDDCSEEELLTCVLIGYEIACRAGESLHDSVCDYHTSGAWVALATAAIGARILKLNRQQTREALGIAEYHGPRSQMMRCIDFPTMLKDGSGWGAMAGVSAAYLANAGFTGAPAITVEDDQQLHFWEDLGKQWLIELQYFKPFPVCRWAQPAVIAAMELQRNHGFTHKDIASITLGSFHESVRLATAEPETTEQAQYSLPFPVAAALVSNSVGVAEISGDGLQNADVLKLSKSMQLKEVEAYNDEFPQRRISDISITLNDGTVHKSGPTEANGDPEIPLSKDALHDKYRRFTLAVLKPEHSEELFATIDQMGAQPDIEHFNSLIYTTGSN